MNTTRFFSTTNFLASDKDSKNSFKTNANRFVLTQEGTKDKSYMQSRSGIFKDDNDRRVVDHYWFRGGWWEPVTMSWTISIWYQTQPHNAFPVLQNKEFRK